MISVKLNNCNTIINNVKRNKIKFGKHVTITGNDSEVIYWEGLSNSTEKSNLIVGNFVSISDKCNFILGGNHRNDWFCQHLLINMSEQKNDEIVSKGDIIIGNDVWIGYGVTILSGSYIPNGCVIGAFSVVSGKYEPYDIIVGNPSKSIKKRFDKEIIDTLLKIEWWNWDDETIKKYSHILKSNNINLLKKINLNI